MSDFFKDNHIAPTLYDSKGRPYCDAPFTPKSDSKRYVCIVPPDKVIPLIFVPGIMGSNLKLRNPVDFGKVKDIGGKAWHPDDKVSFLLKYSHLNPAERRRLLDPLNTEVDDRNNIDECGMAPFDSAPKEAKQNWMNEFKRRGWGTVMLSSYGPLLCHLEFYLNHIYYQGNLHSYWKSQIKEKGNDPHAGRDWGRVTGFTALSDAHLRKASGYWYPVHAVGYNWLKSNEEGGKYLATKIDEIISHYKDKLGYHCEKAILVTHSMGGLVARAACHPKMGNKESKVLGIVHGVMPANGAGAAYKRQRAGFEGTDSIVLGETGPEVAAVFSNSPGALQLLPNKRYGTGWLKVVDAHNRELLSLPKADPYAEIYREPNKWWRLMTPSWLDPRPDTVPTQARLQDTWAQYLKNLRLAESFHDTLGDYYHSHSYVHYGADRKQAAWGNVIWQETGDWTGVQKASVIASGIVSVDDALGHVTIKPQDSAQQTYTTWDRNGGIHTEFVGWRGELKSADEPGDGTVPEVSGADPSKKAVFCAAMTGFKHQGSYQDPAAQELTLYCIARIAQESQ